MLFCHTIQYIFMIYSLLSQNFVAEIYALIPPNFLGWKIVPAKFFAFWMYGKNTQDVFVFAEKLCAFSNASCLPVDKGRCGLFRVIFLTPLPPPVAYHWNCTAVTRTCWTNMIFCIFSDQTLHFIIDCTMHRARRAHSQRHQLSLHHIWAAIQDRLE